MRLNASDDRVPVERRSLIIPAKGLDRLWHLPLHAARLLTVVDAALEGQECTAIFRQADTLFHAVIAHKLHDLRRKFLSFLTAIANAQFVHHVTQAHDAQTDAPRVAHLDLSNQHPSQRDDKQAKTDSHQPV